MIRTPLRSLASALTTLRPRWPRTERIRLQETTLLLAVTLIIGAVAGLVIVAFILITENLGARLYPAGEAAWRRLTLPTLGALVAGVLLYKYFPDARGSGIPQTKVALFIRDGYISLRTLVGKFACSSLTLASGIALGREGPSVHIGAGITSVLGRALGLSPARVKALLPAGTSAALAAAFNTPIAGVLFSLEEIIGNLEAPVLGSAVLSAATSWMVLHLLLGDEPLFHVPAYELVHPMEFGAYAVLGVAGGLISVAFVKLLLGLRRRFLRMPGRTLWLQPVAGGLLVGLAGWFVPEVLGVGYGHVGEALNGKMTLGAMALLAVLKTVATAGCYASGNAGGIFGPSLFIGAMLGGAVGSAAHHLFPDYTGSVGAYALVGMGTTFAGIIRTPLTSVIMIFEVTRDYSIIVPLMVSNLISFIISYRLQRVPIYEALQHQEGVHLPPARRLREAPLAASQAMRSPETVLSGRITAAEALMNLPRQAGAVPVTGEQGLLGMVSVSGLEAALRQGEADRTLEELLLRENPSGALTAEVFPHVHPDHPADTVLRRMAAARRKVLPVVSRANPRELRGLVSLEDVLAAYGLGEKPLPLAQPAAPDQTRAPATLVVGVSAALLGLFLVLGLLTYLYRAERRQKAQEDFQAGNQLVRLGRHEEAIERYRNALAISHDRRHRLALAWALLGAGRFNEAAIYLREVVGEDPTSGPANLGLARVALQQGKIAEAAAHYRRAIFGQWPEQPEERRRETRFELAAVLAGSGAAKQASGELLAILEEETADAAVRRRVGRLLLQYGSPAESAGVFREMLRRDRRDAEAYAGLGEAEFAQANYVSAQSAFRRALEVAPDNKGVGERLQLCDRIVALDPSLRGLSSAERYRRSRSLLESAVAALVRCLGAAAEKPSAEEARGLLAGARQALRARGRPRSYGDAVERDVAMAEQLWAARERLCGAEPAADEVLARVLARLK